MTADHPTIDTIADYHAGLLQPAHQASVAAHLSSCADCTAAVHAVGEVSTILAEAGRGVVAMPDDVANRLDEALRQAADERADADRSGTVVPLERPAAAVAPSAGRRRSWPLVAAAAAVLVVVGTAVVGDLDLSGTSAGSSVAGDAPAAERAESDGEGGAAAGDAVPEQSDSDLDLLEEGRLERLSPARLPGYADRLAQSPAKIDRNFSAASAPCGRVSAGPEVSSAAGDVVSTVRWQGSPAIVVVDPQTRTATVFDCETASVVLFRTEY